MVLKARALKWVVGPLVWLCLLATGEVMADEGHGVILLYHHISDETPPSTSTSPKRFRQHLQYLQDNHYTVMPLESLLRALKSGERVPAGAVAITFDDGYLSVYEEAAPLLHEKGFPFTVFVATAPIDQGLGGYMSWEQVRALKAMGGDIGAHSVTHAHLLDRLDNESQAQWEQRVAAEIDDSVAAIQKHIGAATASFAYPYGEYDDALQELVGQRKMYGLVQHSGAVGPEFPITRIPRFPLATGYDDMERFVLAINSRPLPVTGQRQDGQELTLRLDSKQIDGARVGCFAASGEALQVVWAQAPQLLTIALPDTRRGRNKINCTLAAGGNQEYYWYSYLWMGH